MTEQEKIYKVIRGKGTFQEAQSKMAEQVNLITKEYQGEYEDQKIEYLYTLTIRTIKQD